MPRISYQYDPNDPESRERAQRKAYAQAGFGFFAVGGTLIGVLVFIANFIELFENGFTMNYLEAAGFLILMGIIDFLLVFWGIDKKTLIELGKIYFLFLTGGIIEMSCIGSTVFAIKRLNSSGTGLVLLIISILLALVVATLLWKVYSKVSGKKLILKSEPKQQTISSFIYCPGCGTMLPWDSKICSSCGKKLK